MRLKVGHDSVWFDVIGEKERFVDARRQEKPTLVFVHGGGGNHSSARPWAHRFADSAQCVILDLPGHGRSSRADESRWNLEDWADCVANLCDALEIRRPVFHGASMGGFIVQSIAVRHPDLARGLILASTAARRDRELVSARFQELGGPEAGEAYLKSLEGSGDPQVFADYMRLCLPLYSTKYGKDTLTFLSRYGIFGPTERAALAWFSKPGGGFDTFDYRAALRQVTTPTLIISGRHDPICPPEAGEELFASFPPGVARLEILENASHLVNEDQTDDYVALVLGFLSQCAGS